MTLHQPQLDALRISQQASTSEWHQQLKDCLNLIHRYRLTPAISPEVEEIVDSPITEQAERAFAPFADQRFSARQQLGNLNQCLRNVNYSAKVVCEKLC